MQPGKYDFTIYQGATLTKTITWQNVDLTGYSAAMQLRDDHGKLLLDVGQLAGGLVINGTAGTVTITIPASETTTLDFDSARYDLKLTSTTSVRLLQGTITISPAVTQ